MSPLPYIGIFYKELKSPSSLESTKKMLSGHCHWNMEVEVGVVISSATTCTGSEGRGGLLGERNDKFQD